MNGNLQPAGTLTRLRRYPVKGMSGEDLAEAFVTFAGLVGDRVYAFLDPQGPADFPWMTSRQWAEMLLLKPRFVSAPSTEEQLPGSADYRVEVTTPAGDKFDIAAPELRAHLEQKLGRSIQLRFSERSMTDARPVSVFSPQSIEALSQETGRTLDLRRFRSNFIVDWANGGAWHEESLIGRQIRVGEIATFMLAKKNMRCKVITLDPDTAEAAPGVFEVVAKKHASCVGVYGVVLREGIVRRGDSVFVD
ncbi:MAG: MOSC domain-containing protein [Candidatus Acidiferrales bacterium]